jgi:fructose-bisphosphate aldolase class II
LHGSSGISKEMLQKAIKLGIRKININTEISITGIRKARDFLACHQEANTRFEELAKSAEQAMADVIRQYLLWFDLK